ncbi:MAG: hypothetical protein JNJ54_19170 [Myxococcaceae bacterium]|nr:hypothetical protein [Myxococcaceae bacterium]
MSALEHGLWSGAALSAAMGALIAASLKQDPMIWSRSAPRDVQERVGPPSPETLRRKRGWGVVLVVILAAVFGHLAVTLVRASPGAFPAWDVAVASWVAFQVFNLFDAVVIDLGLVVFKPRWAFVPGTEQLPGLRDVRWHVLNFAKGFVGGFVFAGLVTGLAWLGFIASSGSR